MLQNVFMKKALLLFFFSVFFPLLASAEESVLATSESSDGRIRARLSVQPSHPRLSDTIFLTLTIDTDRSLLVELPVFGTALGDLSIIETSDQSVGVDANRETQKIVLKTIPLKAGSLPIWPIPLRYADRRVGLNEQASTLTVPASRIDVSSAISPEAASLETIRPSYGLIDVRNYADHWGVVVLIVLAGVGIVLFLWFRRRRTADEPIASLTPRDIALKRLEILLESRLHESDVKKFFIELTGIVRWYIEQTTSVRAPELTTEEFLRTIGISRGSQSFSEDLRSRLRLFLESADMVKFAKFQPTRDEIMIGVKRAEEFLQGAD